jgi:hypothetical protein
MRLKDLDNPYIFTYALLLLIILCFDYTASIYIKSYILRAIFYVGAMLLLNAI